MRCGARTLRERCEESLDRGGPGRQRARTLAASRRAGDAIQAEADGQCVVGERRVACQRAEKKKVGIARRSALSVRGVPSGIWPRKHVVALRPGASQSDFKRQQQTRRRKGKRQRRIRRLNLRGTKSLASTSGTRIVGTAGSSAASPPGSPPGLLPRSSSCCCWRYSWRRAS